MVFCASQLTSMKCFTLGTFNKMLMFHLVFLAAATLPSDKLDQVPHLVSLIDDPTHNPVTRARRRTQLISSLSAILLLLQKHLRITRTNAPNPSHTGDQTSAWKICSR